MKQFTLLCLCVALSFGCAHVSQKDCIEKDWHEVGMLDASYGQSPRDMSQIASSCSRFSMANPPENQYQMGYEVGLKKLCTPELGRAFGERGQSYPAICAEEKFPQILVTWRDGLRKYCSFEQGHETGKQGSPSNWLCEEKENANYYQGYKQGSRIYCASPRTAYQLGRKGGAFFKGCPSDLAFVFESAYQEGRQIWLELQRARNEISSSVSRISSLESKANSVELSIRTSQTRISSIDRRLVELDRNIRAQEKEIAKIVEEDSRKQFKRDVSFERSRLERMREEKLESEQEKWRLTNVTLPDLYQQRTQTAFELASARREKSAAEIQLRILERTK